MPNTLRRKRLIRSSASWFLSNIRHPRQDVWHEHFVWSKDSLFLVGLTPTGRATIEALRLNRAGIINLRDALKLEGKHLPSHRSVHTADPEGK